jgi:hypothetical protein
MPSPLEVCFTSLSYWSNWTQPFAVISVILNLTSTEQASVDYTTLDGTAKEGLDYEPASGTLIFEQGELTKAFEVKIISSADPGDKTVFLELSKPETARLGEPSQAVLTIGIIQETPLLLYLPLVRME